MRRKDKEITDQQTIRSILENAEICRLGLAENNEAYIVPVNYAFAGGVIYVHSAQNGRKIDILKQNNKVTFEVEADCTVEKGPEPCNWTTRYRSVMGKGIMSIETEPDQKIFALDLIMHKYGWGNSDLNYDPALLSRLCILKLNIETLTGKQSGNWE